MVPVSTAPTIFKKDEVVLLLGAGASVDAGIPHTKSMVENIERSVKETGDWQEFGALYNYVRSAIYYSDGIRGRFNDDAAYNIERLVEALDELLRREQHTLYPFIGAWNPRLLQVAGPELERVDTLREKIVERLRREWIEIQNYDKAKYYEGLFKFQQELNHPLRVFSLNYDLCVERTSQAIAGELPERGFDEERLWKWQLFEESEGRTRRVLLYKLHGSIDWQYDGGNGRLTFSDSTSKIRPEEAALIFGTSYKLQYVDPFLFLVYEFRRWTLDARLLVSVGYGFGDEHVNGILGQALRGREDKRLVVVAPVPKRVGATEEEQKKAIDERRQWIASRLQFDGKQSSVLVVIDQTAKQFFESGLNLSAMSSFFPKEASEFTEIPGA